MIICGDFNIDLVHVNTSKVANTFFDTMIFTRLFPSN